MQEVDGKVVIVTGAQSGIGLATARLLVDEGAKVVIADLPGTPLADAAASLDDSERVAHCVVDISDEASVKRLMAFTVDTFGRLDGIDNNAARQALAGDRDLLSMDVELWDSVFAVNVRGAMLMCKHAIPVMAETGGGSIVNISSASARAGQDLLMAYATSKGAVNTLTRYVATQYADHGIRCNTVVPGLTGTERFHEHLPPRMQAVMVEQNLFGRPGEPIEIAQAVLFLLSDRSSFITGELINVDGGYYAHSPILVGQRRVIAEMQAERD
jgi:NAD(P)-dependent dehydrogenase (short-subunit alcohol dehydrogenase family)